jgi:hypothetical protein
METVEEYLRQFSMVDDAPLNYVVRIPLATTLLQLTQQKHYLTSDNEMIACVSILVSGTAGVIADLEVNGPFTEMFMNDRTAVWDKIAVFFQNHEVWILPQT